MGDTTTTTTPDGAIREFLRAWRERDWYAMHASLQNRRRLPAPGSTEPRVTVSRLAAIFGDKVLTSARVLGGRQTSVPMADAEAGAITPDMVTFAVEAFYRIGKARRHVGLTVNVIREGPDGQPSATGTWGVNEVSALRETPIRR